MGYIRMDQHLDLWHPTRPDQQPFEVKRRVPGFWPTKNSGMWMGYKLLISNDDRCELKQRELGIDHPSRVALLHRTVMSPLRMMAANKWLKWINIQKKITVISHTWWDSRYWSESTTPIFFPTILWYTKQLEAPGMVDIIIWAPKICFRFKKIVSIYVSIAYNSCRNHCGSGIDIQLNGCTYIIMSSCMNLRPRAGLSCMIFWCNVMHVSPISTSLSHGPIGVPIFTFFLIHKIS